MSPYERVPGEETQVTEVTEVTEAPRGDVYVDPATGVVVDDPTRETAAIIPPPASPPPVVPPRRIAPLGRRWFDPTDRIGPPAAPHLLPAGARILLRPLLKRDHDKDST